MEFQVCRSFQELIMAKISGEKDNRIEGEGLIYFSGDMGGNT
jgi:hypothetical protein